MNLFKLLFLYFLSFTGFLCYGDSFSNGVVTARWGAVNPSHHLNGNSMYYIVSAQKWNNLPDRIKEEAFQIDPEQMRGFFDSQELNAKDMIGHYIGSMGHVEADIVFGKVKMLDEIYTSIGIEDNAFHGEAYNGGIVRAFIAGSSMEDAMQTQWGGLQNWGMNIKVMGKTKPKIRMIGALPFERGVVDSFSMGGGILAKAIGVEDIGVDVSYMGAAAKAGMEAMQEVAGKMVFMKNNTDYVKATMREKGVGIDMKAPYQNLQFYLAEPIGGGGGAAILASMGVDFQDYFNFAERQVFEQAQHWEQLLERGQTQEHDIPDVWVAFPDNPAFLEIWSKYFQ